MISPSITAGLQDANPLDLICQAIVLLPWWSQQKYDVEPVLMPS